MRKFPTRLPLTDRAIASFQCPPMPGAAILWDSRRHGFGVRVSADGATRSYVVCMRIRGSGRRLQITLGRWPGLSLDKAQRLAEDYLRMGQEGVDPRRDASFWALSLEARRVLRGVASMSLWDLVEVHLHREHPHAAHEAGAAYEEGIASELKPSLDRPLTELRPSEVAALFRLIQSTCKPRTAS